MQQGQATSTDRRKIQVLQSHAGFYLGRADEDGPYSRESSEYWPTFEAADRALKTGDWSKNYEC